MNSPAEHVFSIPFFLFQLASVPTNPPKRVMSRAVARAPVGGGGGGGCLNIHIFMLCPIDFFSNQVDFKRN